MRIMGTAYTRFVVLVSFDELKIVRAFMYSFVLCVLSVLVFGPMFLKPHESVGI